MKKTLFCIFLGLLSIHSAGADPRFYNATKGQFKIVATLPNGSKDDRTISPASTGFSQAAFTLAYTVKEIKVEVQDDLGASVWSGKVKDNDTFVLVPNGQGTKMVYCGYAGSTEVAALVLMNGTGEAITLDLTGDNGVGAARGLVPGAAFDVKKAVRIEPTERTWRAVGKRADGSEVKVIDTVNPGRYCLLWKDNAGAYHLNQLGTIKP